MKKQSLCFALVVALLMSSLSLLVSCGSSGSESSETKFGHPSDEPAETRSFYDELEKEKFNREFHVGARRGRDYDFVASGYDGDVLGSGIFERNSMVEEDYGIQIKVTVEDYDKFHEDIRRQVSGGLDEYDAYMGHLFSFGMGIEGVLADMASITTMDLTMPYWDQECRENLVIKGRNFTMTGDINPSSMLISSCLVFNKGMVEEFHKNMPYQMVDNGTWTLDAFLAEIKDVTFDLNGDGKLTHTADRFGLGANNANTPFSFFYGSDIRFAHIDEEGMPVVEFNTEKVIDVYEKLYRIIYDENSYYGKGAETSSNHYIAFSEGRVLYCDITLERISDYMSNMEQDYGIVPIPKYDAAQTEYMSFINGATSIMMIGEHEKDREFVGAILEAMAAYNYDRVTPKMFEIVTKLQNVRDPDSSRMVDYIIKNRVWDFAYFFSVDIAWVVQGGLDRESKEISSKLSASAISSRKIIQNRLKRFKA